MKRIIAFVLLGLMIYAGGFALYFGIYDMLKYNDTTVYNFNSMNTGNFRAGILVEGHTSYLRKYELDMYSPGDSTQEIFTEQPRILGIPVGKQKHMKRYLMEVGYAEKHADKQFCIIMFPEEDIERVDAALLREGEPVEFSGIVKDSSMINAKNNNLFIKNPNSDIIPYIIYVTDDTARYEYIPAVIVGAVLILFGGGGAYLLFRRIKSEKEGY